MKSNIPFIEKMHASRLRKRIRIEPVTDEAVYPLLNDLVEEAYRAGMEKNNFRFSHYEDFIESFSNVKERGGCTFAAYDRNVLAGTVSWLPITKKSIIYNGEAIYLCLFAVKPDYQCYGVGSLLFEKIQQCSDEKKLPICLNTPEKNSDVIRFYERRGFHKIQLFRSDDHLTLKLIQGKWVPDFSEDQCRFVFENSACRCFLSDLDADVRQSDEKISHFWERRFVKYFDRMNEEQLGMLKRCFSVYGCNAREFLAYKYDIAKKPKQKTYLTERTLESLRLRYEGLSQRGNGKADAAKDCGIKLAEGYSAAIRISTFRKGNTTENICAVALLTPENDEEKDKKRFVSVDVNTGSVGQKIFSIGSTVRRRKCKQFPLLITDIPDWEKAAKLASEAAENNLRAFMDWSLCYDGGEWHIASSSPTESYAEAQIAAGEGLRYRLEEAAGEEIDTRIHL